MYSCLVHVYIEQDFNLATLKRIQQDDIITLLNDQDSAVKLDKRTSRF